MSIVYCNQLGLSIKRYRCTMARNACSTPTEGSESDNNFIDAEKMGDAGCNYKEMPDYVKITHAAVKYQKDDARGVKETAHD